MVNLLEDYCKENIEVLGEEIVEDIYSVEEIKVRNRIKRVKCYAPLSQRLVDKLNSSSESVGKNWQVLEDGYGYSVIVSDTFDEKNGGYKYYAIEIDNENISFKTYKHNRGQLPNKSKTSTKMLSYNLQEMINILGDSYGRP
ncbi:hypothetical protein D6777_00600 [Candidatus Woesearchaeota archaeon]|nr:MAG: hypothetical protein D6777_00600 [Candidatus Woesearchaeota archaeon]